MMSLPINFLFVLSVASAVIIHNLRDQQNQYNPYSLYNQPYQSYPTSPLHPRFFLLKSLGLGALIGLASSISGSSTNSSLFSLQFPRVQSCVTAFTGRGCGSCLNLAECLFRKGFPGGICNFGLKTCCVSTGSSSIPVASFTKTSQTTSPASFTILRTSSEFCQVRVDFQTFNIGEVNANGYCINGFWTVAGQTDTNVPILCGLNDGQHVYLNFNGRTPITMSVVSNNLQTDDWNIKVTQIRCSDTQNLAPSGCLQYFPEATGQVQSFSFRNITSRPAQNANSPTYQLSNQDYLVCLGSRSNTYSSIEWTKGTGTTNYYFVMTEYIGILPLELAGTVQGAVFDTECTTSSPSMDYVEILSGQYNNASGVADVSNQFCGLGFPSTVTSTVKPFQLHVVTNSFESESPAEGSVGFSLSYTLS